MAAAAAGAAYAGEADPYKKPDEDRGRATRPSRRPDDDRATRGCPRLTACSSSTSRPAGPATTSSAGPAGCARTRKVGHAGTLDPMATGVLVLGVGRATRLLTFLVGCDKDYTATIRLGQATITDDAEGEVTAAAGADGVDRGGAGGGRGRRSPATSSRCRARCSAIKVKGERAYHRVRAGEDVELRGPPGHGVAGSTCWRPARGRRRRHARCSTSTSRSTVSLRHLRPGAGPRPRRGARRRRPPHRAAAHPGRRLHARPRRTPLADLEAPPRSERMPVTAARRRRSRRVRGARARRGQATRAGLRAAGRVGASRDAPSRSPPSPRTAPWWRCSTSRGPTARSPRRVCPGEFVEWSPCIAGPTPPRRPQALRPCVAHPRQLRRRPPRAPGGARRASSRRATDAGLPGRGGHLRPAPDRRAPPRAGPRADRARCGCATTCSPTPGIDGLLVLDFTERVRPADARGLRRPHLRARRSAPGASSSARTPAVRRAQHRRRRHAARARRAARLRGRRRSTTSASGERVVLHGGPRPPARPARWPRPPRSSAARTGSTGTVVHGDHRGRELGYPTANLAPDSLGLVPADGVYAGWLTRLDLPAGRPRPHPARRHLGRHQPDLRRHRAHRRGLRPRPHRPRPLRRARSRSSSSSTSGRP